jgi:hypothetical protein
MVEIPVLKAWNRIFDLLECVGRNEYNRDGFRDAVLALYPPDKSEKSVFRGMAIPTLRRLGLIVGYEDIIRLSANGALVRQAYNESEEEGFRALRAIQYEIDSNEKIGFFKKVEASPVRKADFVGSLMEANQFVDREGKLLDGSSLRERVTDWLGFLFYSRLVCIEDEYLRVDTSTAEQVREDTEAEVKKAVFESFLFNIYRNVVQANYGIPTVEIEEVRRAMAKYAYETERAILTGQQFDELLRRFPKTDKEYTIAFGRSMGAEEKLLKLGDNYYQTMYVRFED